MKYVVGYATLFDNDLKLTIVEAIDAVTAVLQVTHKHGWKFETGLSVEELREAAFNSDCLLNVLEIPE